MSSDGREDVQPGHDGRWDSHELFELAMGTREGQKAFALFSTSEEIMQRLAANRHIWPFLAENPALPENEFRRLSQSLARSVVEGIAKNLSTPIDLLGTFVNDPDASVREAVASNPRCPEDTILKLAQDEEMGVVRAVMGNPQVPAQVLESMSQHSSEEVRRATAQSPHVTFGICERLAGDESLVVRQAVAANPSTPSGLLVQLSGDTEPDVRSTVALNPSTPPEVLARLAAEDNREWVVAENVNASADLLRELAQDDNRSVREQVAQNPSTPADILEAFVAEGGDKSVAAAVRWNPSAPPHVLEALAERNPAFGTLGAIARNPRVPEGLLERLLENLDTFDRRELARKPWLSSTILSKLAEDRESEIRRSVLIHPHTPYESMICILEREQREGDSSHDAHFSRRQKLARWERLCRPLGAKPGEEAQGAYVLKASPAMFEKLSGENPKFLWTLYQDLAGQNIVHGLSTPRKGGEDRGAVGYIRTAISWIGRSEEFDYTSMEFWVDDDDNDYGGYWVSVREGPLFADFPPEIARDSVARVLQEKFYGMIVQSLPNTAWIDGKPHIMSKSTLAFVEVIDSEVLSPLVSVTALIAREVPLTTELSRFVLASDTEVGGLIVVPQNDGKTGVVAVRAILLAEQASEPQFVETVKAACQVADELALDLIARFNGSPVLAEDRPSDGGSEL